MKKKRKKTVLLRRSAHSYVCDCVRVSMCIFELCDKINNQTKLKKIKFNLNLILRMHQQSNIK